MGKLARSVKVDLSEYDEEWKGELILERAGKESIIEFNTKEATSQKSVKASREFVEYCYDFVKERFVSGEVNEEKISKKDLDDLDIGMVKAMIRTIMGMLDKKK
jgi:hypothetical protein